MTAKAEEEEKEEGPHRQSFVKHIIVPLFVFFAFFL